jgi:hypothetical protein
MIPKVLDDKIEEEEDRQAILGKDVLNPTTGLSLVDYLEGREAEHNEALFARYGVRDPGPDLDTFINTEVGGAGARRAVQGCGGQYWAVQGGGNRVGQVRGNRTVVRGGARSRGAGPRMPTAGTPSRNQPSTHKT